MLINGTTVLYPEDAVILDSKFVMDKFFPLRVKESEKYFIAKKLIIEDAVDADKLVEKNVRFETPCVVMRESKRLISSWKYDGDYAIYNNASYEEQLSNHSGFGNTSNNYYSFYDGASLVGYINLIKKGTEVLLGVGVHPNMCNKGYGQEIVKVACGLSKSLFPDNPVYMEVRTWNARAIRCYEKSGFHVDGEPYDKVTPIGKGLFYRMQL